MSDKVELPDVERMYYLAGQIKDKALEIATLEIDLRMLEVGVTLRATADEKYFINGKAPSQTYIDNSWKYAGFDGELVPVRRSLAIAEVELEALKREYDLLKMLFDIWRTQSANERSAF